jgi:EAL domain-containing protein (putative c-di-GMP-specific phosphodiesterase class I)
MPGLKPLPTIDGDAQDAVLARHSAGMIKRYLFPEGTTLFKRGDIRHCAFFVDAGEVHIYGNDDGGEDKLLCVIGEGEIFGETALIDDTPRTATAVTASESEIYVIPRDALYERFRGMDPIISLLVSILIERYRVTRIHLPESIKQDRTGTFIQKMSKHESLPEEVLRIRDSEEAIETARRELNMEQELRQGLEQKEFVPVLQPIVDLSSRSLIGYEALIRWQHPEKGMIFPDEFIPVAERTNVVQHLDRLMLEKACEILPKLQEAAGGRDDIFVSVNFSGINFGTYDLVEIVDGIIKQSGTNPANIKLEITESALIDEPERAETVLQELKEIGVTIALDDFGTGYSSLGYIHRFAIDDIKIDRSFVSGLHDSERSLDIVRAIVGLAKNFKLKLVAEGIEREEDVASLNTLECDMGQGYLFSKPLELEDAIEFAKNNKGS